MAATPPAQARRDRADDRARIAALAPEALKTLRDQAAERIADVDGALRARGITPADDPKARREAVRSAYGSTLRRDHGKRRSGETAVKVRKRLFVKALLTGPPGVLGIAHRAAEAAGYSTSDSGVGADLVRDPEVKALIAKYTAKWDRTAQDVIDELHRIGFSDMRDYVEWGAAGVALRESDELTDAAASAVAEVQQVPGPNGTQIKFKLHDKHPSLGLLAKFYGLVQDRVELTGRNGGPIVTDVNVHVYLPRNGREADPSRVLPEPRGVIDGTPTVPTTEVPTRAVEVALPASERENGAKRNGGPIVVRRKR